MYVFSGSAHRAESRKHSCRHSQSFTLMYSLTLCEGEGDVVGVVAPLGGVGVQVRVHQDRGEEEDGEDRSK